VDRSVASRGAASGTLICESLRVGRHPRRACPGPIATQVGQGVLWSRFPITGVVIGMVLHLRAGDSAGERAGGEYVDALGSGRRGRDAAAGAQAA
jgi:hypothetical protein